MVWGMERRRSARGDMPCAWRGSLGTAKEHEHGS
jgi:hypothetical protein